MLAPQSLILRKFKMAHSWEYRNKRFGELFKRYLSRGEVDEDNLANDLSKKFELGSSTFKNIISDLRQGRLVGNAFFMNSNNNYITIEQYAIRLAHYLDALRVPEDSEMVGLAREVMKVDFIYPPIEVFPHFLERLKKTKKDSILPKILSPKDIQKYKIQQDEEMLVFSRAGQIVEVQWPFGKLGRWFDSLMRKREINLKEKSFSQEENSVYLYREYISPNNAIVQFQKTFDLPIKIDREVEYSSFSPEEVTWPEGLIPCIGGETIDFSNIPLDSLLSRLKDSNCGRIGVSILPKEECIDLDYTSGKVEIRLRDTLPEFREHLASLFTGDFSQGRHRMKIEEILSEGDFIKMVDKNLSLAQL